MKYDVLLTDIGHDLPGVALAVINTLQQNIPLATVDVGAARDWLAHLPVLLRRGVDGDEARAYQQRYEQMGAAIALLPTKLFFPEDAPMTRWRNEWFSEHLVALHERMLFDWAREAQIDEVYRFSYFPSLGTDWSIRLWTNEQRHYASARRSIGRIGPLPGPPSQAVHWTPDNADWERVRTMMDDYHFWESDSWDTVPDGYVVFHDNHWVVEGWRGAQYHVLLDRTPNEGAAREVGLLLRDLLPEGFAVPVMD